MSIAGGLHRALERGAELDCTAVQIFTHSTVQWRMAPLKAEEVRRFHALNEERGPFALAAHASYLVNLASPERTLREKSIANLIANCERCEALGIPLLVLHPGAHMGAGPARGLRRIAGALRRIHRATQGMAVRTVLEITAGQGSGLGASFGQLARILEELREPERTGICFDTAHAFAAGYDFRSRESYARLWAEFERVIGLDRLAIFHLNDSLRPLGSRRDRHAHIGKGEIGPAPFGWILADQRFRGLPKVIETPKEGGMDRKNLSLLRRLARRAGAVALVIVLALGLLVGCSREDRWWSQVTGFPGDNLGFEDRWEIRLADGRTGEMIAQARSGELVRLDFSVEAGGYSVVHNRGRTVRVEPPPAREMLVDRTLLLTYLLPYMGRRPLGDALIALGIDTTEVAYGVVWNGRRCVRIGGVGGDSEAEVSGAPSAEPDSAGRLGETPAAPAIYFDEETGAVLRMVTIANSPLGRRYGEFRLSDHRLRGGAPLPTRLETWGVGGLRSSLIRQSARDSVDLAESIFVVPPPPEGLP